LERSPSKNRVGEGIGLVSGPGALLAPNKLLIFQEQSLIATALLSSWARPITNYLGRIAHTLEARNEAGGSGGSGLGSVEEKGKEKETEKEQDEDAENGNGNGDKDGDED
jgi:hypothetical protein